MLPKNSLFVRSLTSSTRHTTILSSLKSLLPLGIQASKRQTAGPLDVLSEEVLEDFPRHREFKVKEKPFYADDGRAVEEVYNNRGALSVARNGLGISRRVAEFENYAGRFLINGEPAEPFKRAQAREGDIYDFVCPKNSTEDVVHHSRLQLISFGTRNHKGEELMVVRKFKGLRTPRDQFWPDN